jgi:DnaJ domain
MGGDVLRFEAVLDGVLGGLSSAPAHGRRSCVSGTPDPGLLLSLLGGLSSGLKPWEAVPSAFVPGPSADGSWPARSQGPAAPAAAPMTARLAPPRVLSASQRDAFDRLRAAGATDLDEAFTRRSLKQAFRHLALRYHPDRHPGCTDRERRRLAATFAGVHDAYRTLLGVASSLH